MLLLLVPDSDSDSDPDLQSRQLKTCLESPVPRKLRAVHMRLYSPWALSSQCLAPQGHLSHSTPVSLEHIGSQDRDCEIPQLARCQDRPFDHLYAGVDERIRPSLCWTLTGSVQMAPYLEVVCTYHCRTCTPQPGHL